MSLRRWVLSSAFACGCSFSPDSGLAGESYMDPDLPPYTCMDSGEAGDSGEACETTAGAAAECVGSQDCPGSSVCTASFDGEIGAFSCQPACILDEDDASWCSDDAACCSDGASCVRGLCIPGEGSDTSSTGDGTGTTSGAADTSGSTTSSSESTGTTTMDATSTGSGG